MCAIKDCDIVEIGYTKFINNERIFNRNVYIHCNDFFKYFMQNSMVDSYCSAYRYDVNGFQNGMVSKETELYGNLYLDFDDNKNLNNAREDVIHTLSFFNVVYHIPKEETRIYFSGNKGFHLIIPGEILGIKPQKELNEVFKIIAEQVSNYSLHKTIDLKIYDSKRLFRVPNSINSKTNLYKILLTPDELKNLSEKDIRTLATKPRNIVPSNKATTNTFAMAQFRNAELKYEDKKKELDAKAKVHHGTLKIVPPCIKNILENGAEKGSRNVTIACLTSFYKSYGKSMEETIEYLSEWNSRNVEPTPDRELRNTIKSIFLGDKYYGCSTLSIITECNKEECGLIKSKNNNIKRRNVGHAIDIGRH